MWWMSIFFIVVVYVRFVVLKFFFVLFCVLIIGCVIYYQEYFDFNKEFEKGDLKQVFEVFKKNNKEVNGRSRFFYFVNNGLLFFIFGRYIESNEVLEKVFFFGEDYCVNYLQEVIVYLMNLQVVVYWGEDYEYLMVLYFKVINYVKMNKLEEVLVECWRFNICLN